MRRVKGFTLIELLVVIAVITLLMAILLPTLQRIKKQARAVACQSNLKQWGTLWAMSVSENDGHFPDEPPPAYWVRHELGWAFGWGWGWYGEYPYGDSDWHKRSEGIWCCPTATKRPKSINEWDFLGGTFTAWSGSGPRMLGTYPYRYGSYGTNDWLSGACYNERPKRQSIYCWRTLYVKGTSNIPMMLDSGVPWAWSDTFPISSPNPPTSDAIPTVRFRGQFKKTPSCMNRHDGFVNGLFLDWSVRKVGLKELWTLKWNRESNTANKWTRAGGVQPEDWPQWMSKFKDY